MVPMSALPSLMLKVKALCRKYGVRSVCYGHAGDGNIHVNLLKEQHPDPYWNQTLPIMIEELFEEVHRLGGTVSGEHGIGWSQKRYMALVMDPVQIQLMKGIKAVFDPLGLLNPGKIWEA